MSERGIPRHVRTFITEHLSSVAQLEILLLLRSEPEREFFPKQVAEELRIETEWASEELRGLHTRGVLAHDGGAGTFRFAPRTRELATAVEGLAAAFATHRVSVITLLFSTPSDSIGSFADAFKIRRDTDDG